MKLRSARDILGVVEARGMSVRVDPGPPPMPVLVRPRGVDRSLVSDALLGALKAFRLEIIEELSARPQSS
jgi:hypothetical protein